jgi:3-isopropylmalate/(R)-2-methylmalate dehydratase small subunit
MTPARRPLRRLTSRCVALPMDDVDTDQIIPARFLKSTERSGFGAHAFHDWRYDAAGNPKPAFPLNQPDARGAHILVAGRNFGCGSSREHAVWALLEAGFQAVISSQFADIFRGNALGNGLLPVQLEPAVVEKLMRGASQRAELTVDLDELAVTLPDGARAAFAVPPFARHCLLRGLSEMDFLLEAVPDITQFEAATAPAVRTARADLSPGGSTGG